MQQAEATLSLLIPGAGIGLQHAGAVSPSPQGPPALKTAVGHLVVTPQGPLNVFCVCPPPKASRVPPAHATLAPSESHTL